MIVQRSYNAIFIFFSATFLAAVVLSILTSLYWIILIPFGIIFFYFGWLRWQAVFFLLILTLPWSFEYSFNSTLGTDLPDEPLMLITSMLFLARLMYKPALVTRLWKHPLVIALFASCVWIALTVPFSTDWLVSLKFLLAKGWYVIAFVLTPILLLRNKESIQTIAVLLTLSMLSVVMIVLRRQIGNEFRFANVSQAVVPFFRNHVNYSAMLVCIFPVLLSIFQLKKKLRGVILLCIVIVSIALFFSYSRGAWLALLVGIASYWLIKRGALTITFGAVLVLIAASVIWLSRNDRYLSYSNHYTSTIFHTNFEEHLIATYKLKDLSTAERFNRWVAGVRMIGDKPIAGYGPNTFYSNYKPYTIPVFRTWVSDNKEHSTVHNYFLLVLIEQGIPGFLFFLLLIVGMLYYSEKLYARIQDKFYKTVSITCGVMVMMIITVNFLSDLVETDKVGSLFYLCLGLLVVVDAKSREMESMVGRWKGGIFINGSTAKRDDNS